MIKYSYECIKNICWILTDTNSLIFKLIRHRYLIFNRLSVHHYWGTAYISFVLQIPTFWGLIIGPWWLLTNDKELYIGVNDVTCTLHIINIHDACVTLFTPVSALCCLSEAINGQLSIPRKWGFAEQHWYRLFTRSFFALQEKEMVYQCQTTSV